jgi:hypothetical protein
MELFLRGKRLLPPLYGHINGVTLTQIALENLPLVPPFSLAVWSKGT